MSSEIPWGLLDDAAGQADRLQGTLDALKAWAADERPNTELERDAMRAADTIDDLASRIEMMRLAVRS